jgi:hypothetical protein
MFPEYPMDLPKGWLAAELKLYAEFGIAATAKTPYTQIHLAVRRLPDPERGKFLAAWQRLCINFGRDEHAQQLWK